MKRFVDKVSIITGSSNGIGRATAVLFANEGSKITITGRDAKASAITKSECLKAGAKEADILEILGDITKTDVQDTLVNETVKKFGKLDILINNHGSTVKERDEEGNMFLGGFQAAMKLNCESTVAMSLKSLPYLKKSQGAIVNVSSIAAKMPGLPTAFYGISKAALDHVTKVLAIHHAKDGVRVNAVNPGVVVTAIFEKMGYTEEQLKEMINEVEKTVIPCGKAGEPMDIAKLIAFLADNDSARYITGQTVVIDGGTTLMQPGFGSVEPPTTDEKS